MSNPILYIIARNDLDSLNPGKLAAQVAHAASAVAEIIYNEVDKNSALSVLYKNWINSGGGFGTTIVLQGSKEELLEIGGRDVDPYAHILNGDIVDPTYPFMVNKEYFDILNEYGLIVDYSKMGDNEYFATRKEHTCSWFFGEKEQLKPYVGELKLYK